MKQTLRVLSAALLALLCTVIIAPSVVRADAPENNILQVAHFNHSGYCLSFPTMSQDGGSYYQGACNDPSHVEERFQLVPSCVGCVARYVVNNNGKCMTVASGSTANGAVVNQYTCTAGATNQKVIPEASSVAGYYTVKFVHSGKCLAVVDSSQTINAQVHQWACADVGAMRLFFDEPLT